MTDGAVLIAIIAGIASVVAGVVGPWLAFRAARSGHAQTAEIEQQRVEQSQAESWRQDAQILRVMIREERAEAEQRMDALEHKMISECDGKVAAVTLRVDQLLRELTLIETRLEAAVSWIRQVVPLMRAQGTEFPPIPPGIVDTDPNGYAAIRRR